MKLRQFVYLGIVGVICLQNTQGAKAQGEQKLTQDSEIAKKAIVSSQFIQTKPAITQIPKLSDIQLPYTTVRDWLAQETQQSKVMQVTGVRLIPSSRGLNIILETPDSRKLLTTSKSEGNSVYVIIPKAQLRLKSGNSFRKEKPLAGITEVQVTNQDANSIRVTITGEMSLPSFKLFDSNQGLVVGITPSASITQQQQPQTSDTQKPSRPTPQAEPSTSSEPIELVVTGEPEDSYNPPNASTTTKLDLPRRDIPQSIQVIPRQVIEDRQAVRLGELVENVSGLEELPGYGGSPFLTGYYFRGLSPAYQSLRNGFRDIGAIGGRDIANVDRVEFFKGPASVLYGGRFSLGGLVNTVTKKPLDDPSYNINATIGSYDFYRSTIDFTGPIVSDRSVLYRLNLAYQNAGSFRDFNNNESFFAAPAFTWKIDPRTNLTVELEQQHFNYVFDYGFPAEPEALRLPINRFLGQPNYNGASFDSTGITYNLEHQLSHVWKIRQGFSALIVNGDTKQVEYPDPLEADRQTLPRSPLSTSENQQDYVLQNEISGEFKTGPLRHKILGGLELSRWSYDFDYFRGTLSSINIFNPQYGAQPTGFTRQLNREQTSDNLAAYVQDFIEILPNLKLLAGVRYDLNDASVIDLVTDQSINQQTTNRFSPRVGIVYQPTDATSLYFSWANSFNPQFFARSRTGQQFRPTTGEQFEIGIKQDLLSRLSMTLALYQITQQNALTTDPVDPTFSIATGEQKSRGVELDVTGEILPGWKIIANYAYTDAFVSRDNTIPIGDRIAGIPENSASLWTTYELQKGNLRGLRFGLGLVYQSEREAQLPNTLTLPSYVRVDAALAYRRKNLKIGLNVKNLFDTKYYNTDTFYIYPQAPLTVLGTVSVQF